MKLIKLNQINYISYDFVASEIYNILTHIYTSLNPTQYLQ